MRNWLLAVALLAAAALLGGCSASHQTAAAPSPGLLPTAPASVWQAWPAHPHPAWTRLLGGQPVTCYYVLDDGGRPGHSYALDAPGPGRQIETTAARGCYVFADEVAWAGHGPAYLMRASGGGDCAAYVPQSQMVYSEPCNPAAKDQLWWPDRSLLVNWGATVTACGGSLCAAFAYDGISGGSQVVVEFAVTSTPASPDDDWTTPDS